MKTVLLMPCKQAGGSLPNGVLDALLKLDPQPDLYIFSENNSTDRTLEWLTKFPRPKEIIRLWFRDDAMRFCEYPCDLIAIIRDLLLRRTRQLDVDFAIFIDSDIMIHSTDLIPRLTSREGDIMGGLCWYPRNHGLGPWFYVAPVASAFWPCPGVPDTYMVRSQMSGPDVQEVAAAGAGCLCLNRRVIEDTRLSFYPILDPGDSRHEPGEDASYCVHARSLGYKILFDITIQTTHLRTPGLRPWWLSRWGINWHDARM